MSVIYFSSTGGLGFNESPYPPPKPILMVVADDPFKPDEVIEPTPRANFRMRARPVVRTVLTILSVAALIAAIALASHL